MEIKRTEGSVEKEKGRERRERSEKGGNGRKRKGREKLNMLVYRSFKVLY